MNIIRCEENTSQFGDKYTCKLIDEPLFPISFVKEEIIYSNVNAYREIIHQVKEKYPITLEKELNIRNEDEIINKFIEIAFKHSFIEYLSSEKNNNPFSPILFYTTQLKNSESFLPIINILENTNNEIPILSMGAKIVNQYIMKNKIRGLNSLKEIALEVESRYF